MNTSESTKAGAKQSEGVDLSGSQLAAAAGLPDPAILARMANEFFRAMPGESGLEQVGVPTDISSLQLPSTGIIATEADLVALTNPVAEVVRLPTDSLGSLTTSATNSTNLFGMPGFSTADLSAVPTFSFLQEARSIFGSMPAVPIQSAAMPSLATIPGMPAQPSAIASSTAMPATNKMPTENDVRGYATSVTGPLPAVPATYDNFGMPQVAGASVPVSNGRPTSFDFLQQLNPLEPINVVPSLTPLSSDLGFGSFSDLTSVPFDVEAIRRDFPILNERVNGRSLIWLDNAATTQKPQSVIDRISYFYEHENSNIHRAAHTLAARATDAYEASREKVRRFLNASSTNEILFVRGATEGINLVAQSWGRRNIQKDDEIVITWLEHHANIVPWQMLCAEKGARLRVAPVDNNGQILLDEYERLLGSRTKLVAFPQVSNALGTITPVQPMVEMAHRHGARVLVDGAQALSHMRVDMQAYDCDFYVFSGHKLYAPTGIGVVYGKADVLDGMPPWQGGGNMISDVTFEKTVYQPPPGRFEAGTGNIADAVGLGAAIDYLDRIGMANIDRYEHELLDYATEGLRRIPGLRLIGTAPEKASVLSFVLDGYRTEDVGAALAREGIAVRSGHHCAQPILRRFGVESTVRPSLAFYNTCAEIDALIAAVWSLKSGRNLGPL